METDGRRDITSLVDGRVLGPFSQKCQDSTFQMDSLQSLAGLRYFNGNVGTALI